MGVSIFENGGGGRLDLRRPEPLSVGKAGAVGDGVVDDYRAFLDIATTLGSAGGMLLPPGTYRIGTNLTINCQVIFALGATLKPDAGVTVTLDGPLTTAPGASIIAAGTAGTVSVIGDVLSASTSIDPVVFGAVGDGVTDDRAAWQRAVNAVGAAGGGVIDGRGRTYCIDSGNGIAVNYDNVFITNCHLLRTDGANTGFTVRFGLTTDVNGGGVRDVRFTGIATVAAMGGLQMGNETYKANRYVLDNVEAVSHGQYGVAIEAGDDWKITNVRVREHGLTTGSISSCMGFYVYPKIASSGGQLTNVSSEISAACQANASANTAAIKLQTHQNLVASGIRAMYGSESTMLIDSPSGIISDVIVFQQGTNAGLAVGNYSTAHAFSGQTFTLDGFRVVSGGGSANNNEFVIGGGVDGEYKLTGCVIRNGSGGGAGYLALSNCKDCTFENLDFQDIRFDSTARSFTANSVASTNNRYFNVRARGGALTGFLYLETTDSLIANCGVVAIDGDTVSSFQLRGNGNVLVSPYGHNVSGNALTIIGDDNNVFDLSLGSVTGRSVWFQSGSDNNRVHSGNLWAGTGQLDNGTGNYYDGSRKVQYGSAAPAAGTWAVGDRVYALVPAAGGYIGWVCTTAGTPGTWKEFGAIVP